MAEIQQIQPAASRKQTSGAADLLLAEGPTIERVRQKDGARLANSVSPILERRFASLSQRLVGGVNASANLAAGNDADGVHGRPLFTA